ncbi:MAG: aldehyde ferredoxin oxidoreductase family protein [Chloroflexi bacterium]|nr:aldehyde ferredoxin oxidoreductase family protein [Chloroflexota bacterium]
MPFFLDNLERKEMAGGYMGKVPWVDLSSGTIVVEEYDESLYRDFIGGYGLGARLIYERQSPGVEALGPANTVGFFTGPLTGTPAIISSRFMVMGKSPLTGAWGDANCGGYFGPHMKFAGVDGVFFTGIAEAPVYLLIDNGKVELRDAAHLWGKDTAETEDIIMGELGKDVAISCIGPSGEKISLISAVIHDGGRAAARCGVGALMGSKNLKAVVVRGNQKVPVADVDSLKGFRAKHMKQMMKGAERAAYLSHGTVGSNTGSIVSGDCPIKNWGGSYPDDYPNEQAVSGDMVIQYQLKKYGCWHCPIACGGHVKIENGPYAVEGHKPEYETVGAFGPLCLNENVESIFKTNDICNLMGLDTISTGATIAFAIECYENGLITKADTDGIELTWGSHEAIVQMTEKLAKREGFGEVLADGVKVASEKISGSEEFAVHVHGQELAMHDGKISPGLALAYEIDPGPGRHTSSTEDWAQPGLPVMSHEMTDYGGRGRDHMLQAAYMNLMNCAGLCWMGVNFYDVQATADFMRTVTGWEYSLDDLFLDGERIFTMRHLFTLREGLNPLQFRSPGRSIGRPPLQSGSHRDVTVDVSQMARDFYSYAGYNLETAMPCDDTLKKLGLHEVLAHFG